VIFNQLIGLILSDNRERHRQLVAYVEETSCQLQEIIKISRFFGNLVDVILSLNEEARLQSHNILS
jgi:hypothetical protein